MVVDLELGGDAEVALAPGREADVTADARHLERPDVLAHEVLPDDIPTLAVAEQSVRVDRALLLAVARDRPVVELGGALLGDRALELAEPAGHVGRVVGVVDLDLDAQRGGRRSRGEARAAEREVLQREAQRLRVRELSLEHVEGGLERRELVVGKLERREEVLLRRQRVELLAGELIALRLERHSERQELGPVGVEAPRERLVRHLLVALDVLLHVARRQRPTFGHQECHERKLAD